MTSNSLAGPPARRGRGSLRNTTRTALAALSAVAVVALGWLPNLAPGSCTRAPRATD